MDIFIAGVGMTTFGDHRRRSLGELAKWAIDEALADADCPLSLIEAAWFANACQGARDGQHMIRGQIALRSAGLRGIPIVNVENACASASTAMYSAIQYLASGEGDIAIAVGAEKMFCDDKALSFSLLSGGIDVSDVPAQISDLAQIDPGFEAPFGARSVFMDIYAAFARQHMRLYGSTQRQMAAASSKSHTNGSKNPRAQYRTPLSIEQVLGSREIVRPLTLSMCAPISDGAAAAVICTTRGLARLGSGQRSVQVAACVLGTSIERQADDLENHIGARTARKAYEKAGLGPHEMDVAEVHDAAAIGEILQIENLGLVPRGEGGLAAERGDTAIGGRIPVNPSGGLVSKGHPVGATGLAQIFELVQQLRGEAGSRQVPGAKHAIAENGGGVIGLEEAVCAVTILVKH